MRKQKKGANKRGGQEYISAITVISVFCEMFLVSYLTPNQENPNSSTPKQKWHQWDATRLMIPNSYFNILCNTTGILVA